MAKPDRPDQKPRRQLSRGANDYLRFTGLGISMVGIILVFCLLGWWLDGLLKWRFPVFTLSLSLLGIAGAMMHLFREVGRK